MIYARTYNNTHFWDKVKQDTFCGLLRLGRTTRDKISLHSERMWGGRTCWGCMEERDRRLAAKKEQPPSSASRRRDAVVATVKRYAQNRSVDDPSINMLRHGKVVLRGDKDLAKLDL